MNRRLELHEIFIDILGTRGQAESKVYFQPPSTVKMKYPCIVYERAQMSELFADNAKYSNTPRYTVTVIDPNPDSDIPEKVSKLPTCRFSRHYTAENLNHDVYDIYY